MTEKSDNETLSRQEIAAYETGGTAVATSKKPSEETQKTLEKYPELGRAADLGAADAQLSQLKRKNSNLFKKPTT